ncbi:CHAT domain-containing protein [Spirulina sp. CS-785/01]|uniref:CHAT domain-containing protein n=1 Tax=Spirulina sp. CS-785/01 TaxID=3021716 RepID=UPI00232F4DA3|nr:CHAT domain-containing protein [Spirulina sp. CS-785/01]MDB9314107.1 CHAT domain-containing protein [Spirulina sp. CS-785/01]
MNWFKWFRKPQPQEQPPQPVDMDTFVPRLLKLVKQGMTRDAILRVLASRQVTEGELAAWLRQRDTVDEEGLRQLGERVGGELEEGVQEILSESSGSYEEISDNSSITEGSEVKKLYELLDTINSNNSQSQKPPSNVRSGLQQLGERFEGELGEVVQEILANRDQSSVNGEQDGVQSSQSGNDSEAKSWFNRGNQQFRAGDFSGAVASYDQALTLNPQDHLAWHNRGAALDDLGRKEEAIASYDQALTLNPQFHLAWYGRGNAAASSPHFNPQSQQNFLFYFPSPVHFSTSTLATPKTNRLLSSLGQYQPLLLEPFNPPQPHQNFSTQFHTSLQQSQETLRQTFANSPKILETLTLPSLEDLQQSLSISSTELLKAIQTPRPLNPDQLTPTPEQLQNLKTITQQPPSQPIITTLYQTAQNHFNLTHPELNQRGFWGKINSLQFPLTHNLIRPDTHPEAWGFLHHQLGKAYLKQSFTPSQHPSDRDLNLSKRDCWRKAKTHYKQALQTLTFEQSPKQHLQVLKDLIQVCQLLQDPETDFFLQEATTRTDRILRDPNLQSLIPHILPIQQYTVDRAVQQNQPTQALHLAETAKNTCLRWLWGYGETPTLKDTHFQQLLTPNTALLYWHYSPNALTTFLLLPNQPTPLLIPSPTSSLDQLLDLEKWIENWHTTYNTHSKKTQTEKPNSPWRNQLANQLQHLHTLLNIPAIEQHLQTHNIQTLLLIPHRDLHRFPLHSFFNLPATYLPSAYLAFFDTPFPRPLTTLNLVENPQSTPTVNNEKKDLASLPYAEIEAALLRHKFPTPTSLQKHQATHPQTLSLLTTRAQVFHFCGHAAYNAQTPLNSCLFLQGEDTLTLEDILQQDLNAYALVSLAACETAITGNHSITDEYVGLVSAFLQTGVTYVLSTLWQVESFVTSLFMVQFYDTLQQGTPPIPALYQTQQWLKTAQKRDLLSWLARNIEQLEDDNEQAMLEDQQNRLVNAPEGTPLYADPYYWAGFILAGYDNSPTTETQNTPWVETQG